jgi:2-aminoadipate transaminase
MPLDPSSVVSDIARSGPPLFFPDPPVPVTFNFDQGVPAEETFPIDDFLELHEEVIRRDHGRALEYISMGWDEEHDRVLYLSTYVELVLGNTDCRDQVAQWISRRQGLSGIGADNIILTSGSVQAVALAINATINKGDTVYVEAGTFPYALRYLEMRGAMIRPVPVDDDGMDTEALAGALAETKAAGGRPKMVYTIATFQLPTGACTSLPRRLQLLELAEEYDLVVLEDNVYGDLRYSGEPLPTLLSLDTNGRVIQDHSFSKVCAPGIRLGWAAASEELIGAMAAVRQDLGVSQWTARAMAEYLRRGKLDPHIDKINAVYRSKRDVAAAAVREHCGEYVTFNVPDGGFYLWLEISDKVDWEKARDLAQQHGVAFRPGERFMGPDMSEVGKGYIRLAFCHVPENEIRRGIAVLGEAITKSVKA